MDPSNFVSGIPVKASVDREDKKQVVAALKMFYSRFLADDRTDGSDFDCRVLSALDDILK